jgi:type VI secretion system protein ImpM
MPETEAPTGNAPGFFGKLPSHGDFISRRLPTELLAAWEAWLDAGLQHSRDSLGDAWLQTYLSSPIWCFSASANCCGAQPFAGVLMPSLDRVGRYYSLSIVAPFDAERSAAEIASGETDWFARMEEIALSCLGDDFDFAAFDAALAAELLPRADRKKAGLEMPCPASGPAGALPILLGRLLQQGAARYSLWWTSGSKTMAACCRAFPGLPPVEEFCRLLR